MVLLAIFQPPRRLTHRQIMALSLRDVSKIMAVRHPQSKQQIEHTPESLIHHQMSGNLSKSHVFDTPAHEPETAFFEGSLPLMLASGIGCNAGGYCLIPR
jgi:hypothetical protein